MDDGITQFNWVIWRERNRVVFEDMVFSPNRMKLFFISALISWVGLIPNVEYSLARQSWHPCILPVCALGVQALFLL